MKIKSIHPDFPAAFAKRATRWAAGEVGLLMGSLKGWQIVVSDRLRTHAYRGWCDYRKRKVDVLVRRGLSFPVCTAHTIAEREAGRDANDAVELLVGLLVHELEHARISLLTACDGQRWRELQNESRVRAIEWRAILRFRENRDALLAEWSAAEPTAPAAPAPTRAERLAAVVDRRAARAAELLAQWETKLRAAKTRVAKYRQRVRYYERRAASRQARP